MDLQCGERGSCNSNTDGFCCSYWEWSENLKGCFYICYTPLEKFPYMSNDHFWWLSQVKCLFCWGYAALLTHNSRSRTCDWASFIAQISNFCFFFSDFLDQPSQRSINIGEISKQLYFVFIGIFLLFVHFSHSFFSVLFFSCYLSFLWFSFLASKDRSLGHWFQTFPLLTQTWKH